MRNRSASSTRRHVVVGAGVTAAFGYPAQRPSVGPEIDHPFFAARDLVVDGIEGGVQRLVLADHSGRLIGEYVDEGVAHILFNRPLGERLNGRFGLNRAQVPLASYLPIDLEDIFL